MSASMYRYRVFVSYARQDKEKATKVVEALEQIGLIPFWDSDIQPGFEFSDTIKKWISRAHLFVQLLTPVSRYRPWVHQETGFAIALNIPVMTISIGGIAPSDMTASLQVLPVRDDLADLSDRLKTLNFERLMSPYPPRHEGGAEIVDFTEPRSAVIAGYANQQAPCEIRHRGPLSSFSIPDRKLDDPIWEDCGEGPRANHYLRSLLRDERRALERHARIRGCRLLLNPEMPIDQTYIGSKRRRIEILIEFLNTMTDETVTVALLSSRVEGSIIIVGDWFFASSHAPMLGGYRQTVVNWHAPTVLREILKFDDQLSNSLASAGIDRLSSRRFAITYLSERL